jgi:predicted RNase H-like HicB family nuclease
MKYKVVIKKSKEGYSVSCPGLPGCWSQGKTENEALENIQDAIRQYLAAPSRFQKARRYEKLKSQCSRAKASGH